VTRVTNKKGFYISDIEIFPPPKAYGYLIRPLSCSIDIKILTMDNYITTFINDKCSRKIVIFTLCKFRPYLDTATGKLVENTKAYKELTIIKELGKLTT